MKNGATSWKLALLASASCIVLAAGVTAHAQTLELPQPPVNSTIDARGVDLASGQLRVNFTPLTIGDPTNGLKQSLYYPGLYGFRHDQMITATADDYDIYGRAYGYHVSIATGQILNGFSWNTSTSAYVSDKADGASLVLSSDWKTWTYTDRHGNVVTLDRTQSPYYNYYDSYGIYYDTANYYGGVDAVATAITRPDGFKTHLTYKTISYNDTNLGTVYVTRLQSTTTSSGYQLKFSYRSNSLTQSTANAWVGISQEQMINNAVDYCDPTADSCSGLTQSWPTMTVGSSVSGSNNILSFTDPVGRTNSFTFDSSGRIIGFRRPSASSDTTIYGYNGSSTTISSVSLANIGAWNYTFSLNSSTNVLSGTVTTPTVSMPASFTSNYTIRQPLTLTDENSHTTTFTYDSNGRVKTRTLDGSGSNYATYSYDARGNLTSMVVTPKSGSGLGTLTTSAAYPSSCTGAATCNKPTSTTNSEGQVTNYYYNSNGTLDYVQAPAPTSGAARPETHYNYTTAQAQVKNASGAIVSQGDVVTLPAGSTTCVTGSYGSCTAANQIVTQNVYYAGPSAANLGLQGVTVKSGSGSPSSTTSYAYDNVGNVTSVTDPVGNVSTTSYAADRQPLVVVSPSIDGSGTSLRRGIVYHYNADGLRDSTSYGAYNPSNQGFTTRRVEYSGYDSQGRKTLDGVSDGTTTFATTQYSYNGAGRLDCTAVRMNPTIFGSLPSSACTIGTQGSYGPDRITHNFYDNAGQVLTKQVAYGTSSPINDVSYTYTSHNLPETMTDANGNLTSFVYDGHDRLLRTCYQGTLGACQAATSSDYVQLGYSSAGRPVSRSLRGSPGSTIGYTYDYLGRVTNVSYPGGGAFDQPVAFAYDNLGRQLTATDGAGHSATYSYDAVGNVTAQGDATSSRTMLYDAAGRRTRLTWSDGRYVTYDYNGASDLADIKESGNTLLATYAYDDIGRRQSVTFGNGMVKSYSGYSPQGPASMVFDLAGTANDMTLSFSYNPAGQIASRTSSSANTAYMFSSTYNINRSYGLNGLNQYTSSGPVTLNYDARGNLTGSGTSGYAYSTKNELVQRTDTGTQFYHDPLGRLDTITTSTSTTKLQYDGANISTELDGSGTILRRYVFGSAADEPLVWYEGSDFSDRRYLASDERGSVIAVTDGGGNPLAINSYDEYGIPGLSNIGRFQYTGQAWIPELGMYSYKARVYSPTLGRFMHTDPAGYPDGPNWYAYAKNDPVNAKDPSGLDIDPNDYNNIIVNGGGPDSDLNGFLNDYNSLGDYFGQWEASLNSIAYSLGLQAAKNAGSIQPKNKYCGVSGVGLYLGGSVEGGAVEDHGDYTSGLGFAGQASISRVNLGNGQKAVFATTGGFYNAGGYQSGNGTVFGGSAGIGGGLVFTNAQTVNDFSGSATSDNFNIGSISFSYSYNDAGINTFTIGAAAGPPGFSFSSYTTNTRPLPSLSGGC